VYSVRDGARTAEKNISEGVYIADRITEMVGRALLYDAKTKSYRICRYSDIAVLTRNKAASDITEELKRRASLIRQKISGERPIPPPPIC
jgi:ATP-dependent exoDNAse (exonuclease V) beta subunit